MKNTFKVKYEINNKIKEEIITTDGYSDDSSYLIGFFEGYLECEYDEDIKIINHEKQ